MPTERLAATTAAANAPAADADTYAHADTIASAGASPDVAAGGRLQTILRGRRHSGRHVKGSGVSACHTLTAHDSTAAAAAVTAAGFIPAGALFAAGLG